MKKQRLLILSLHFFQGFPVVHFFLFHSPLANHQLHFRKKQSISSAEYAHYCIPIQSRLRDFKALIKVQLGVHILSQIRGAGRREEQKCTHQCDFHFLPSVFLKAIKSAFECRTAAAKMQRCVSLTPESFQKRKELPAQREERRNEKQISCTTHIKVSSVLSVKVEREGGLNKDDNPCPVFSSSPHYDPPGWHHIAKSR